PDRLGEARINKGQVQAAAPVPGQDWWLGITLPLAEADFWTTSRDYLVLLALASVELGLLAYSVAASIASAPYRRVQGPTRGAGGDLTARLSYLPVRDEFSARAIAIDKLASRQHDLVKLIKDSSDALGGTADLFGAEAKSTERLAQAQRLSLGSLA